VYEAFRDGRNHAAAGLPLSFRRATERHDETRAASLDHLVGTGDERRRKLEAKCLAVLRFTTKSNFVGCNTGKSPGFSPLRVRAV
jgi:hypothetical protein